MIQNDAALQEVLREKYGAQLLSVDGDYFTIMTAGAFPTDIAELSSMYSVDFPAMTTYSLTGQVHHNPGPHGGYTYTFLHSAHSQLRIILHTELEKKRYKEFAKSFDSEVQSELGQ
jgi:hypothetical protein